MQRQSSWVGAYWGDRPTTPELAAERLAGCLERLGGIDEALERWFEQGRSRSTAKTPIPRDVKSLAAVIARGVNRTDSTREPIPQLGWHFGMWNRARPEVGLSGSVGAYSAKNGILNSSVLRFDPYHEEVLRLYDPSVAHRIFEAIVESWEPDNAIWATSKLYEAQEPGQSEPVVGWMTYVKSEVPDAVPHGRSEPMLEGSLITINGELADVTPATVLAVRGYLKEQGALSPIS